MILVHVAACICILIGAAVVYHAVTYVHISLAYWCTI